LIAVCLVELLSCGQLIEASVDILELFEEFGKDVATPTEENCSSTEKQIEQVSQRFCHFPYQECCDKHIRCFSFIFHFARYSVVHQFKIIIIMNFLNDFLSINIENFRPIHTSFLLKPFYPRNNLHPESERNREDHEQWHKSCPVNDEPENSILLDGFFCFLPSAP